MKDIHLLLHTTLFFIALSVATPEHSTDDDGAGVAGDPDVDEAVPPGNVTECRPGFGYPESCPQPGDPANHTRCCRYYHEPGCCEQRANRVCASKKRGLFRISGWDIDPDPEYAAVFCPRPGQSDRYTSCAYTREEIGCFNRNTLTIIIATTVVMLAGVAPAAFIAFVVYAKCQEKRHPELKDSAARSGLEDARFVPRDYDDVMRELEKYRSSVDSGGSESTATKVNILHPLQGRPDARKTPGGSISEA